MIETQNNGSVERITVPKPVSFRGNVFRHGDRNRMTPDDTGIVAFTIRRYLRSVCVSDLDIRI